MLAAYPEIKATLSLAGRTRSPVLPQINHRIGGFGGVLGLADYIKEQKITALICATHPFAQKMPFNAAEAAKIADIPIIHLLRPQWQPQAGDNWLEVSNHKEALSHLIPHSSSLNIFLTVGRLELAHYTTAPEHNYLIRSIDEIEEKILPNAVYITARPPFNVESETELLKKYKINYIISKNSGGQATEAKLTAARNIGIPVIMIKRPPRPEGLHVKTAQEAMEWILKLYNI